jgi:hypothetical protein
MSFRIATCTPTFVNRKQSSLPAVRILSRSFLLSAVFESVQELDIRLREAHVLQPANLETIYGALAGELGILVEGPPGTGKMRYEFGAHIERAPPREAHCP